MNETNDVVNQEHLIDDDDDDEDSTPDPRIQVFFFSKLFLKSVK